LSANPAGACVESETADEEQHWAASMLLSPVLEPSVRVWTCVRPAVVLGRAQRPDECMALRAESDCIALCRRATGGGAILAGPWMLGTTVLLPLGHPLVLPRIAESFRWFGQVHADWLNGLGVNAKCVSPSEVRFDRSLAWAYFGNLSHWEVEADGGKIVGLSQARTRNGMLLSSAVLVGPPPWTLLCDVMGMWRGYVMMLTRRTASCAQLLGKSPSTPVLALSLLRALEGALRLPVQ
jgi:lipoate---protein ligase